MKNLLRYLIKTRLTGSFAPLAPQNWGKLQSKSHAPLAPQNWGELPSKSLAPLASQNWGELESKSLAFQNRGKLESKSPAPLAPQDWGEFKPKSHAPLTPQDWGELESKSLRSTPRIGGHGGRGFRRLSEFADKVNCKKNDAASTASIEGFTMIELLVAAIVSFLIITPLLGFVVNILNDDQREQAKASTDQEIQAALNFIEEDLSQAIYIYDREGIDSITANAGSAPIRVNDTERTPVLVFWKRKLVKNGVDIAGCTESVPEDCKDDTHVLSLVAYYIERNEQTTNNPWCPSGSNCPAQITRFEIKDGARNPATGRYICGVNGRSNCDSNPEEKRRERSAGFPTQIDTANLNNVTAESGESINDPENRVLVLVNYIDASTANVPDTATCTDVFGIDTNEKAEEIGFNNIADANNGMLIQPSLPGNNGEPNSFYACVNTFNNVAQVYIRGNALRRTKDNNTDYDAEKSSFFPTGSIQVKGLGRFGTPD